METLAILDALVSHAVASGYFERVNKHEPKNTPGNGLSAAIFISSLVPARKSSGCNTTSIIMTATVRIYGPMVTSPLDMIDVNIMEAAAALFTAYSGDFTLDGMIRDIDLLGSDSDALTARTAYVEISKVFYRLVDINVPMIINDVFDQAP